MHRVAFGGVEHPHGIRILARLVERVCARIEAYESATDSERKRRKDPRAQPVMFVALQVAALITESELEPGSQRTRSRLPDR